MALYNCIYDAKSTQLGFSLKYFPHTALSESVRRWIRKTYVKMCTKSELVRLLNEQQTHIVMYSGRDWEIVWKNNAVPTELEWVRWKDSQRFHLEFRETALHGRTVILSRIVGFDKRDFEDSDNV